MIRLYGIKTCVQAVQFDGNNLYELIQFAGLARVASNGRWQAESGSRTIHKGDWIVRWTIKGPPIYDHVNSSMFLDMWVAAGPFDDREDANEWLSEKK